MSDIFESSLKEPPKRKKLHTSLTHEEPLEKHSKLTKKPANKLCGKAGQGKKSFSLCCSTKRRGWESPDLPGVDFILACCVGAIYTCKQQLPSMKSCNICLRGDLMSTKLSTSIKKSLYYQ